VSLESNQSIHNSFISNAGNVSSSNDPAQKPHDANELLIKGASLAAAGKELGLSEEETLAAVSRQYRRQDTRAAIRARRTKRAEAERTWTQKQASLGNWGDGEIEGVGYKGDDDVAFAFGEDVEYNSQGETTRADDEQTYRANDRGFTEDEETGLLRRETFKETRGDFGAVAPKSVLTDALSRIQSATSESGYDGLAGSADIAGRLEEGIQPDRGADAALGAETARRENARFNPEMREYNDNRAEAESQAIAREFFGGYGSGSMADDSIGRIAEIRSLGKIGETAHVVRTANDAIKGQALRRHDGVFLDPATNDPIAVQGPELPAVLAGDRTPNNGSTSDALNSPQTAREWVTGVLDNTLSYVKKSDKVPQVDITTATTTAANKVRDFYQKANIGANVRVPSNIRSIDELQRVAQRVSESTGGRLMMADPENPGKQIPAGRNVVSGALQTLGLTQLEQSQLGQALYQLDAASRSSVNQNPTGVYLSRMTKAGPRLPNTGDIFFDSADAIDRQSRNAKVARMPRGSTIGVKNDETGKIERKNVVGELQKLQGEDAQRPFIGQVEGEKPRVNRFRRGGTGTGAEMRGNLRRLAEERAAKTGRPVDEKALRSQQVKASLVEEREKRDSRKREEQRKLIQERTPANLRQTERYDEADKDIKGIENQIKVNRREQRIAKAMERRRQIRRG